MRNTNLFVRALVVLVLLNTAAIAGNVFLIVTRSSALSTRSRVAAFQDKMGLWKRLERARAAVDRAETFLEEPPLTPGGRGLRAHVELLRGRVLGLASELDEWRLLAASGEPWPKILSPSDLKASDPRDRSEWEVRVSIPYYRRVFLDKTQPIDRRLTALDSLKRMHRNDSSARNDAVVREVIQLLRASGNKETRIELVRGLAFVRTHGAAQALLDVALRDRDREARMFAAAELTVHREDELVSTTLKWLADSDPDRGVRGAATRSLEGRVYGRMDGVPREKDDDD